MRRRSTKPFAARRSLMFRSGLFIQHGSFHLNCPLCDNKKIVHWHRRGQRDYWCCERCALVFVPPAQHLSPAREKAEYDKHDNRIDDPGYRRFLSASLRAVTDRLAPGSRGLDFGCGPGPALAAMLAESGYPTRLYDLYYHLDESVWNERYDFITLTEVIEHLAEPRPVLDRLWERLHPGGVLVIQTQRVLDRRAFRDWRYLHDLTHIAFYSETTFAWLGRALSARVECVSRDVAVLGKPA